MTQQTHPVLSIILMQSASQFVATEVVPDIDKMPDLKRITTLRHHRSCWFVNTMLGHWIDRSWTMLRESEERLLLFHFVCAGILLYCVYCAVLGIVLHFLVFSSLVYSDIRTTVELDGIRYTVQPPSSTVSILLNFRLTRYTFHSLFIHSLCCAFISDLTFTCHGLD